MRILYSVLGYKPAYHLGGPILSVAAVAERLAKKSHKIIVFAPNVNLDADLDVPLNQPLMVEGVEVWYFKRYEPIKTLFPFIPYLSKSIGFLYAPKMKKALDKIMPTVDLAHTHLPFIYPTYATAKTAQENGIPLFYHQRGVFDPARLGFRGLKKRLYISAVERPIMLKATTLIALTEAEKANFRALEVNTPCEIIPNGIDVAEYRREPEHGGLEKWHISDDQTVLLFLGRLHPIKGVNILLDAFTKIYSNFPKAVLVIAGPDEYKIAAKFRQQARDSGMLKRVIFPGMVEGKDKINLLARADLFCLPSLAEGFSMAVLEAMASATAVLLSPGCRFPEIEQYNAGWIVERESDMWAEKLGTVLKDRDLLKESGKNALELVKARYSWDMIVDRLESVYREGMARHARFSKMGKTRNPV
jgi:glycosyltransferase involved in cell wall biosynthesis